MTKNRICFVFDENGGISDICADSPIDIYLVEPSRPNDRVYLYGSANFGPEHVRSQIGGYSVGHVMDGTLDVGGTVSPRLPPSKPALSVVKP